MFKGPLILWLVIELGRLYLTSAELETVVRAYWGQTVTLPCTYLTWSQNRNSMCWGKGECPKSKCNEELIHTDGKSIISKKSTRYSLWGLIRRGELSLTIYNLRPSDSGTYCCRIEVPGWFNDVKNNIHLQLLGAPSSTHHPTMTTVSTMTAKTTPAVTTPARTTSSRTIPVRTTSAKTPAVTTALPTMFITTPDLTTQTPLQTTTAALTAATTCPSTTSRAPPEVTPTLLPTQPSTEGAAFTEVSKVWVLQSTSQTSKGETRTFPHSRASETTSLMQSESESKQINMADNMDLLMITIFSLGLVLLALFVGFFLRRKILKTGCIRKHKRLNSTGESKNDLNNVQCGREDEEGLFTL